MQGNYYMNPSRHNVTIHCHVVVHAIRLVAWLKNVEISSSAFIIRAIIPLMLTICYAMNKCFKDDGSVAHLKRRFTHQPVGLWEDVASTM